MSWLTLMVCQRSQERRHSGERTDIQSWLLLAMREPLHRPQRLPERHPQKKRY
jgi:hypothetical protein